MTKQIALKTVNNTEESTGFDREDFEWILREHQSMVFSIAFNYSRNRPVAEELAQDVFLSLYERLTGIKSREHLVFWLRKVTVQRCLDYGRRSKLRAHARLEDIPEPTAPTVESDVLLSKRIEDGVDGLPQQSRMVVVLRFQEDMEPAEIAKLMDMPLNTVKSHLRRSLSRLRQELAGFYPD